MKVVEIFNSIEGEGIRAGQPATFIRLAGCNLRCSYCDTAYALFGEDEPCVYEEMTINEIISKVNMKYKRVTLTGGEPLIHKDCHALIEKLIEKGCEVNVETNGAADITDIPRRGGLFFTIDYKLSSSGMTDKMMWNNFLNLKPRDVVKLVVGSEEDMAQTVEIVKKLKAIYDVMPHIFIGTVYGMYDAKKAVNEILSEEILSDARFQVQLHKIIWNPLERGV